MGEEFREVGHLQVYGYGHGDINPLVYTLDKWTSCFLACVIHPRCSVSTYVDEEGRCAMSLEVCPAIVINPSTSLISTIPVSLGSAMCLQMTQYITMTL